MRLGLSISKLLQLWSMPVVPRNERLDRQALQPAMGLVPVETETEMGVPDRALIGRRRSIINEDEMVVVVMVVVVVVVMVVVAEVVAVAKCNDP